MIGMASGGRKEGKEREGKGTEKGRAKERQKKKRELGGSSAVMRSIQLRFSSCEQFAV